MDGVLTGDDESSHGQACKVPDRFKGSVEGHCTQEGYEAGFVVLAPAFAWASGTGPFDLLLDDYVASRSRNSLS